MSTDNIVACYEGIQRVYRNAVVEFIRQRMATSFPADHEDKLRKLFSKEWDSIEQNARVSRDTGELSASLRDAYDLLGVNHFYNIIEKFYGFLIVTPTRVLGKSNQPKQVLLNWLKEIKNIRDPLSHPAESDFSYEDSFRLLDTARRVLMRIDCTEACAKIVALLSDLRDPIVDFQVSTCELEASLPPRETIVTSFIGRKHEIELLWKWFDDPVSRRWALAGEGGKGKTAIAYQFACEVMRQAPAPYVAVIWMSAKQHRYVEGRTVDASSVDFCDLNTALTKLLAEYGFGDDGKTAEELQSTVLELLDQMPVFLVVDDIDSVVAAAEDVIEFLCLRVPQTKSKVLFTSRRIIFGMGGSTTPIKGFMPKDAHAFIDSRCTLMGIDPAQLSKSDINKLVRVTEGSPLFIEDLLRLSTTVSSLREATELWQHRKGNEARRYALGREVDMLSENAKLVLFAACVSGRSVSFAEIEAITGLSSDSVAAAIQELQRLFLVPKPELVADENLFEVNVNTSLLVKSVYQASDTYRRMLDARVALTKGTMRKVKGDVGAVIRQARALWHTGGIERAEKHVLAALQKFHSPDLLGYLAVLYQSWKPRRVTDSRERFEQAYGLKCKRIESYMAWVQMELHEKEWTKSATAAEKGLSRVGDNRELLFLAGYARCRIAKDMLIRCDGKRVHKEHTTAELYYAKAIEIPKGGKENRDLDSQIRRALVLVRDALGDQAGVLRAFQEWRVADSRNTYLISEWHRLSKKYVFDPSALDALRLSAAECPPSSASSC